MNDEFRPLRIAHYTNVYKPMKNGVVTSVESLKKGQLEQGHAVYVVGPTPSDRSYVQEAGVFNIAAVALPNQAYPFALPCDPGITNILHKIRPDVLHTHHPVGLGRYAGFCSQRHGLPLVFTFHTWYEDFAHYFSRYIPLVSERQVSSLMRYWIRKFIKQCHHVVAPGRHARDRILQAYGDLLRGEDISVVPTGIDLHLFSGIEKSQARASLGWAPEERYLVSCGRLSKEKNFELLLDAVALMEENSRLVILGDGDLRSSLQRRIADLGLQDRVELPGNRESEEVARYFAAADLFAFASPNETQGLVVLEAMAAGTPTVVVGEGGVADFVRDGVNGLTAQNDSADLARALDHALRASDLSELSARAFETAAGLSIQRQVERMNEVYAKAIRRQQGSGLILRQRINPMNPILPIAN